MTTKPSGKLSKIVRILGIFFKTEDTVRWAIYAFLSIIFYQFGNLKEFIQTARPGIDTVIYIAIFSIVGALAISQIEKYLGKDHKVSSAILDDASGIANILIGNYIGLFAIAMFSNTAIILDTLILVSISFMIFAILKVCKIIFFNCCNRSSPPPTPCPRTHPAKKR
ncbi:hypothetical protein [Vandammella animalimorsus]|uniref:hypothetical protein n=1 Tax=Vandammella animalimorsus TaxID=2029117 RepID=UPI0011782338|nr:hypothetical protein [Vandammella animalimorsus]